VSGQLELGINEVRSIADGEREEGAKLCKIQWRGVNFVPKSA
jgi:hypothetical protein